MARTPKTSSPAKTTAQKAKPATRPHRREKTRHQAVPYLPSFIDMACDAVSQLLSTGGHDQDVTDLVRLSIRHHERQSWLRRWSVKYTSTIEQDLQELVAAAEPKWKATIEAAWKQADEKPTEAIDPKTLTDRIRAYVHSRVKCELQTFLGSAGPEELRFMLDVLEDRNQDSTIYTTARPEYDIPIATWFEYHSNAPDFDNKPNYIRVPEKLVPKVQKYVDALAAVEGVVE